MNHHVQVIYHNLYCISSICTLSISSISTLEDAFTVPLGMVADCHYKLVASIILSDFQGMMSYTSFRGKFPIFRHTFGWLYVINNNFGSIFHVCCYNHKMWATQYKTYHLGMVHPTHVCFMVSAWRWVRVFSFITFYTDFGIICNNIGRSIPYVRWDINIINPHVGYVWNLADGYSLT